MLKTFRAVVAAFLMVLVAQPVAAGVSEAADSARGAVTHPQAATSADTGLDTGLATDLAKDYSWDNSGVQQAATVWLPDERTGPMRSMAQIALALLMIVVVALGLTITFASLRKDMKQRRRVVYRPRGPPRQGF